MCFPVSASHWIYWCLVVWLLLCSVFIFSSLLKFNLSLFKQSTEKNNKNIQQTGTLITNFSLIQAKFFLQSHLPVRIFNPMRWSILHVCPFYFLFSAGPWLCHGYVYACLCVTCIMSAIKFLVIKSFMAHLPFFKYRPDRYIVSLTLCLSVMFFLLIISNKKKLFFFLFIFSILLRNLCLFAHLTRILCSHVCLMVVFITYFFLFLLYKSNRNSQINHEVFTTL